MTFRKERFWVITQILQEKSSKIKNATQIGKILGSNPFF